MNTAQTSEPFGECFFFDVGQGSANAIIFRDRRAILVDTGRREAWRHIERLLEDKGIRSIECVVLSHNDEDHVGGWEQCAMTFGSKIKSLFLVHDRQITPGKTIDVTWHLASERLIPEPRRAEQGVIWQDQDCSLEILSPTMRAATAALKKADSNSCSAVVMFRTRAASVLYAGDAGDRIWDELLTHNNGVPLTVDVATLPHHGSVSASLAFPRAVQAQVVVVSVASNNAYGHPSVQAVSACRQAGTKVVCTQITEKCHALNKLAGDHVVRVVPQSLCRSHSRYRGCGGTIVSVLTNDGIRHPWQAGHDDAVRSLDSPMCLNSR